MPKDKGPIITVHGQQVRALPDEVLERSRDQWSQEILHWRQQVHALNRVIAARDGELAKAESTIRNQDVELRRIRARVAQLESVA